MDSRPLRPSTARLGPGTDRRRRATPRAAQLFACALAGTLAAFGLADPGIGQSDPAKAKAEAGKTEQFDALKGTLTGQDDAPRDQIAARLAMTEGAVKVAVHRLRQRYRMLLRAAIAETVSSEADLDDEMRYLVAALRRQ